MEQDRDLSGPSPFVGPGSSAYGNGPPLNLSKVGAFTRRLEAAIASDPTPEILALACELCVDSFAVTGAAVSLRIGATQEVARAATSWRADEAIERELALNQGPNTDAHAQGRRVLVPDLADDAARWPRFVAETRLVGVEAVFAFPLREGMIRLGTLSLYGDEAGPLADEDGAAAAVTALRNLLFDRQVLSGTGSLPALLEAEVSARAVVHQAVGILAVKHGLSLERATRNLRQAAYAQKRSVLSLSRILVDDLSFDRADPNATKPPDGPDQALAG